MFENIFEKIFKQILGDYIEGFDGNNLNMGIWTGNVEIKNVSLKKK
jgi:vacuolar protein sorting-associated protein 13A/C